MGSAAAQAADSGPAPDELFGLTRIHRVHLGIAARDYAKMDPPAVASPFGGGRAPVLPPGSPDAGAGNMGFEFSWVAGDWSAQGIELKNIGLRYKGSGTYMMSQRQAKRSFKIDFDRNVADQAYLGVKKLNLNSGVMDPTKVRETLAYAVYRAAGIPAPRTAFAEVTLTVPGKYDKEYLGLYTIVEQVDERFLKTHFHDGTGLLLKPEGIRGLPHLGDDPAGYEKVYNAKSKPGRGDWKRLVELTRLVNKADEAVFRKDIGAYLEVDAFVRYLAATTLLSSMDGFIGMGHNYYLYLSPVSGRFSFLPWDLDLAFGAFPMFGTPEQLADLSIDHPHLGENKLIDRLLAMPEVKKAYHEQLRKLAAEVFTAEKLGKDLTAVEALAKGPIVKEREAAAARREGVAGLGPLPGGGMGSMFAGLPVATFMEKRVDSVTAQLAGKSTGFAPRPTGFGPGGGPGAAGNPVGQLARQLMDSLDADKSGRVTESEFAEGMRKHFAEWDKDKNGSLDQREIAEGLQRLTPAGRGR
jgi:spore coat protein CotH